MSSDDTPIDTASAAAQLGVPRRQGQGGPRVIQLLLLREGADVDEQVRGWLTEAFLRASDGCG